MKENKQEQKNLLLALLFVIVGLIAFDWIFPSSNKKPELQPPAVPVLTDTTEAEPKPAPAVITTETIADTLPSQQLTEGTTRVNTATAPEVNFRNEMVSGSFATTGGTFNQLNLLAYTETTQKDSPNITLFTPNAYQAQLYWISSADVALPRTSDIWQVQGEELTPFTPITLRFHTTDVQIERKISLDNDYMFTITDIVQNMTNRSINLALKGKIEKQMTGSSFRSNVHEGFVALANHKLEEKQYASVDKESFSITSEDGWVGITEKYWQSIFIPQQEPGIQMGFNKQNDLYTASFQTATVSLPAGQSLTRTTRLFAGAKKLSLIKAYQQDLNIPKFDLTIDFGWFYFLTKPFLSFLNWLYALVGNMGVAILIFATLLRIALLPIATKSYQSMAKMKKVQPKIKALQEQYKNDKMRLNQEMLALYQREKINPAGGCLPLFIQIPVFFALYKVLSVSLQMRQAPFFGWIHDLSMPDPSSVFTLFGYVPWPIPSFLDLGVWPILMGLTMYIQQKLNPAPTDKSQADVMKFLPIIFTFMLGKVASGLVIYWTWSNILSIAQQQYIMRKEGKK